MKNIRSAKAHRSQRTRKSRRIRSFTEQLEERQVLTTGLAVAFIDVDGDDQFTTNDTLIAEIVDTDNSGDISVGDTLNVGSLPTSVSGVGATAPTAISPIPIVNLGYVGTEQIDVFGPNNDFIRFDQTAAVEQIRFQNHSTAISDWKDGSVGTDWVDHTTVPNALHAFGDIPGFAEYAGDSNADNDFIDIIIGGHTPGGAAPPAGLAVAYIDVDSDDQFTTNDTLIAEIVDTDGSGAISIGDTLNLGSLPDTVFGTTSTAPTSITPLPIVNLGYVGTEQIDVFGPNGDFIRFDQTAAVDQIRFQNHSTAIADWKDGSAAIDWVDHTSVPNPLHTFGDIPGYAEYAGDGSTDNDFIDIIIGGHTAGGADPNSSPTIVNQSFVIDENSDNGLVVGTAAASDPDLPSDVLSWSITAGNTSGAFAINSATGEIVVDDKAVVDFETTPAFNLTVQVEDAAGATDSATVTINLNDLQATLAIDDAAVVEGDAASTTLGFAVAVSGDAINVPFDVNFDTMDGSAVEAAGGAGDNDYQAAAGLVSFDGSTGQSQTIDVTVNGDTEIEALEVMSVQLGSLLGTNDVTVTDATGQGSIYNNDGVTDGLAVAYIDVDGDDLFTTDDTLIVEVVDADGSGSVSVGDIMNLGSLPTNVTGTGATAATSQAPIPITRLDFVGPTLIAVYGVNDNLVRFDDNPILEQLRFQSTAPNSYGSSFLDVKDGTFPFDGAGHSIADPTLAFGDLAPFSTFGGDNNSDNDFLDVVIGGHTAGGADPNSPPTIVNQSFVIDENSDNGLVVGTAAASDPDLPSDVLSWSITAGNTSGAFAINSTTGEIVVDDKAVVDFETTPAFNLTVQVEDAAGATDSATVTINLNDLQATLAIDDAAVVEGDAASTTLGFAVAVSGDAINVPFGVNFDTMDGSAVEAAGGAGDNDYQAATGLVSFDGSTGQSQTIDVIVNGDTEIEALEVMSVQLGSLLGTNDVTVTDATGQGSIYNNDGVTDGLAVAYIDVDGDDLFTTDDTLIVEVVDADGSGSVSVGDIMNLGSLPTNVTGTGATAATSQAPIPITRLDFVGPTLVAVYGVNDNLVRFDDNPILEQLRFQSTAPNSYGSSFLDVKDGTFPFDGAGHSIADPTLAFGDLAPFSTFGGDNNSDNDFLDVVIGGHTAGGADPNSPPTITAQVFAVLENESSVGNVVASDADLPGDTLTFSITGNGPDDSLFAISSGGSLSFLAAPDYESPNDVGGTVGDNIYLVQVAVEDIAGAQALETMTVSVDPVNDIAPSITSLAMQAVVEGYQEDDPAGERTVDLTDLGAAAVVGQHLILSGMFDDADNLGTHTVTVDWGDGVNESFNIDDVDLADDGRSFKLSHVFETVATQSISVSVDDGVASGDSGLAVDVQNWALQGDVLAMAGTDEDDDITIRRRAGDLIKGKIRQRDGGVEVFNVNMADVNELFVLGRGGNDYIAVSHALSLPSLLDGGAGDDAIIGGRGADKIIAGEGNDLLIGRAGDDVLLGGAGNDFLKGNHGDDQLDGGAGSDAISAGSGEDTATGGEGIDVIFGQNHDDIIYGNEGDDWLYGGNGDDTIYGNDGDDHIWGGNGNDQLFGGAGDDWVFGGNGADLLIGDDGNDLLFGGRGNDIIDGGAGNDLIFGGNGDDTIDGGADDDIIFGGRGNDSIDGGAGGDWIFDNWSWVWDG